MFHKLVKLVHIDVDQKLRCEITKRQTFARFSMEASDDSSQKLQNIPIRNVLCENMKEDTLVNRSEKLPYITLEYPNSPCMIVGSLASKASEAVDGFMDSFIVSAGI